MAWAVVNETGAVDDGRIWRHRDKAEKFHAHASRNPDREYHIVPLYAAPVRVTEAQVEALSEVAHDAYEKRARVIGWQTQAESRRPWSQVPEANQECTRAAVRAILAAASKGVGE